MVDLNEQEMEAITKLFNDTVGLIGESGLPRHLTQSVLAKVIVLFALGEGSKDEFLGKMSHVFDFESMMRPESQEIH